MLVKFLPSKSSAYFLDFLLIFRFSTELKIAGSIVEKCLSCKRCKPITFNNEIICEINKI